MSRSRILSHVVLAQTADAVRQFAQRDASLRLIGEGRSEIERIVIGRMFRVRVEL